MYCWPEVRIKPLSLLWSDEGCVFSPFSVRFSFFYCFFGCALGPLFYLGFKRGPKPGMLKWRGEEAKMEAHSYFVEIGERELISFDLWFVSIMFFVGT